LSTQLAVVENVCESHYKDWKLLVAKEKKLWELQVAQGKMELFTLQTANDWESMAIKNKTKTKTKTTLYDELVKQLPIEMGDLLEEAIIEFRKWHFKQIGKWAT